MHNESITYLYILGIPGAIFNVEPRSLLLLEHLTYWLTYVLGFTIFADILMYF